ncbi:hypothetical protein Acy02nite_28170 [Actinoplanes cyaneus]|uniref:Secreted protein n=1 Tax=Actinoplanes cyaneus TaxID=52696 RepID=A0A919IGW1_9ACTN|nr:DUF6493 family protein [Actinoplanes cyaneus]MCW2137857.1 hypothetical protein [Actinoplanes cyaneus]GID64936.1 hypothetical protein Acy02nite_28170 [Actinoplanes cyaneus]
MTLTWEMLQDRALRGDPAGLLTLLIRAPEQERLAIAGDVEAGIRKSDRDAWWRSESAPGYANPNPGYALAVIGCMPTAARAAALLTRGNMRTWATIGAPRLTEVARFRQIPWQGELGRRIAERLPARDADGNLWPVISALLQAGDAEPPITENVVRAWHAHLVSVRTHRRDRSAPPPLSMRLRDDPHRDVLLPGLFEFAGLGADMSGGSWNETTGSWSNEPRLPGIIAYLIGEGILERKTYVDLTVDRLLRGGKPNELRPFALLHDALEPTVDELSSHALDYARLLPEAPGAVATLAQKALRTVDDAGRLELETLLDTSGPTLVRKEKTLVKAQLTWLERVARREPARAGEVLETVAAAFGHPALDVQERALVLIGKQIAALDPGTVARLADASAVLAGDLPARAAGLFGVAAPVTGDEVPELPPAAPPAAMPPPITTAAELAEELVVLVHERSAIHWERVLAGLVTLYATEGSATLRAALQPVLDRYPGHFAESSWNRTEPLLHLGVAIHSVIDPGRSGGLWGRLVTSVRTAWQDGRRGGHDSALSATPDGVLGLRVAELATQLTRTMVPLIMATPTHVTGSVDPSVLLERLRRAEAEGWQPWPVDFEQALLRLPRRTDPGVVAGATALTSPAGRQFAAWLTRGGLPDPVTRRFEQTPDTGRRDHWARDVRRVVAAMSPARDGGLRLERQLLTLAPAAHPEAYPDTFHESGDVLTMVLPHHREAAAAWVLPELAAMADQEQRAGAEVLPLLAECSGPVGPALAYGVAYGLGARHQENRIAAGDAFLTLAGRPEPFAAAVGAALTDLGADGVLKLSRVVPALTDVHRAGASVALWEVLAAALPGLLPAAPRGLPDLLELSTQVARAVRADSRIAGLAEIAARDGSSRLVKEARRLQTVLGH